MLARRPRARDLASRSAPAARCDLTPIPSVSFTVRMQGLVIGHSELESEDRASGLAHGAFRPAEGYELVQDIFALYRAAVRRDGTVDDAHRARYFRARDALKLQLIDDAGRVIDDAVIHIALGDGDAYQLEVHTSDPAFWRGRAAGAEPPRT